MIVENALWRWGAALLLPACPPVCLHPPSSASSTCFASRLPLMLGSLWRLPDCTWRCRCAML